MDFPQIFSEKKNYGKIYKRVLIFFCFVGGEEGGGREGTGERGGGGKPFFWEWERSVKGGVVN